MSLSVKLTTAEDFKEHISAYRSFLRRISQETANTDLLGNMGEDPPGGFLYLIHPSRGTERRWTNDRGQIALLYEEVLGSIVGISAVEDNYLSEALGSGGNRCWLQKNYRLNREVTRYLLSSNLDWCAKRNKVGMMLTFNDYNREIYEIIAKKSSSGVASLSGAWSNWWDDCVAVRTPILFHHVQQWAVIKPVPGQERLACEEAARIEKQHGI
jgi:hypothetical protein